jgi:hypothetical protein
MWNLWAMESSGEELRDFVLDRLEACGRLNSNSATSPSMRTCKT